MTLDCVLFDHDDTLVPTFALRARALEAAAVEVLGRRVDGEMILGALRGRRLEQKSVEIAGGDAALAGRLVKRYRALYYERNGTGLAPYPGIAEMLESLASRGTRLGVVTSKLGRGARGELERTGLLGYFSCLLGAEDVVRTKPDAEPLRRALETLGVHASAAIMVGDSAADVLGARAAGTRAGAALWGARDPAGLRDLGPDVLLAHPREVLLLVDAG